MGNGLFTARTKRKQRKKARYQSKDFQLRLKRRREKGDLLEGAPMGRGIVLQKVGIESKQPNSAIRKCVRVLDEHDEVMIEGIHGPRSRSMGDIPGVRYKVSKVNGVPLKLLVLGKAQKAMR